MEKYTGKYDLAIMGNYTKDTIISPSGTRNVDGGGFNYGVHVGAMMGLKTAAITRLAEEDNHVVHNLEALGIDVYPYYCKQSTLMELYYPTTDVDNRILTVAGIADSFAPEHIAEIDAKVFMVNGSIRGEVGLEVLEELKKKDTILVADVQGFIRIVTNEGKLQYDSWPGKEDILSLIDVLKSDAVEAEAITGETDIKKAAKALSDFGPREIVLTHRDGLLVFANGNYYEAPFLPAELIGRSGRGDTCVSSYMAKRLTSPPEEAIIWSVAVTSLKMEAEGPILREVKEVRDLINKKYGDYPVKSQ